jgi:hypothetical protein
MGEQKTASHRAAELAFSGRDSARRLKGMIGGDQATFDELALQHISANLKGKDAAGAEKWLAGAYRDWAGELSPQAQQRVAAHFDELKKTDLLKAAAGGKQKELSAQAAKIPGETERKVTELTGKLTGGKEPVERIRELLTTANLNRDEARAVYAAVQNAPGGKEAFKRAVELVIKDSDPKKILDTFDNRIANKLVDMGSHTPQEVSQLRGVVQSLHDLANVKVASRSDYLDEVKSAATHEAMKGKVIGSVVGALAGGFGGHSAFGMGGGIAGAVGGAEGVGIYAQANAMVRNEKRIMELINQIIADKDLFNAAIAPPTEGNVKRFMGMLAQGAQRGTAIQSTEAVGNRAKKAVGLP